MKKYIISVSLIFVAIVSVMIIEMNDKNNELYENQSDIIDIYDEHFESEYLENDDILLKSDEKTDDIDLNIDENTEIVEKIPEIVDDSPTSDNQTADLIEKVEKITISVSCKTILDNLEYFPENKHSLIPSDGVILPKTSVEISDGDSVFDILTNVTKENKIHMEFVNTPIYGSAYIEGINNIYEFDCGDLSGWMYKVNGQFPSIGISNYVLNDNDVIEIVYSCDLGKDL